MLFLFKNLTIDTIPSQIARDKSLARHMEPKKYIYIYIYISGKLNDEYHP